MEGTAKSSIALACQLLLQVVFLAKYVVCRSNRLQSDVSGSSMSSGRGTAARLGKRVALKLSCEPGSLSAQCTRFFALPPLSLTVGAAVSGSLGRSPAGLLTCSSISLLRLYVHFCEPFPSLQPDTTTARYGGAIIVQFLQKHRTRAMIFTWKHRGNPIAHRSHRSWSRGSPRQSLARRSGGRASRSGSLRRGPAAAAFFASPAAAH